MVDLSKWNPWYLWIPGAMWMTMGFAIATPFVLIGVVCFLPAYFGLEILVQGWDIMRREE